MPPDISNSGRESIRGFLTRFLPKMLRPKSDRIGDGWQQQTIAPGFLRDYPTLFPQQQGPSFITPTQRALDLFQFPFNGTPNPPDEPPVDDPPGTGTGDDGPDPPVDPPGSGSGSGSGPGDSGSGSGMVVCPYYFLAETCNYGSGEPACGVGSGIELYLCADLECLDGPGSGSGPEVPMDGQVFEYLNRCWVLDTAVEYYRNDPPPGGQLLPNNAVVVSEATLNCLPSCLDAGCARADVWFLATPCEACEPPDGTLIPAFCGADWADTVGTTGDCVYFQYGGYCYWVGINSTPIDAIDGGVHVAITRADFQATLVSCCQCCDDCMYVESRTPSAVDEPCAAEIDCCCGSEFNLTLTYNIEQIDYALEQCDDGSWLNYAQYTRTLTGTYKLSFDGNSSVVITNTLNLAVQPRSLNTAACSAVLGTLTNESVDKPGIDITGCSPRPYNFWPSVLSTPIAWEGLLCSCELLVTYNEAIDAGGNDVGVISLTPDLGECFELSFVNTLGSLQPICFPGEAFTYERVFSEYEVTADCESGTVTFSEAIRAYSSANDGGSCYGVYQSQSTSGSISWHIDIVADCDDGCTAGPGSGDFV